MSALTVVLAAASIVCAGCGGDSGRGAPSAGTATRSAPLAAGQTSVASRPTGVPNDATLVGGGLDLGNAVSSTGAPREATDIIYAVHCRDGIVVIATTRETLYAERPCDRVPADEAFRSYYSKSVPIRISAGEPRQLSINSDTVGSLGFAADRIWLQRR